MSFGERLRAARENKGYTQQQIADLMKIDKSTYCGYETGKRQPDVQKIKQLSVLLGVSGDELLETGFENKTPLVNDDEELTEYLEMLKTRPECRMLFQLSKDATKEDVEKAVRIIEALRGK